MKTAEMIRRDMEDFVYGLDRWIDQALDNDNVSDETYDFVRKMYEESKQELHDLSVDIIAGQYDEEEQVSGSYLEVMNVLPEKEEVYGSVYYINNRNDEETIWHLSYSIKKGHKQILQNCHYFSVFHPESMTEEQIHDKLIDMLHRIEKSEREDIDPSDSFDTIIKFVDPDDDQDPTPTQKGSTNMEIKHNTNADRTVFMDVRMNDTKDRFYISLYGDDVDRQDLCFETVKGLINAYRQFVSEYDLTVDDTAFTFEFDRLVREADTFDVYEGHMDDLRKKVRSIQKKADKYGCDFHYEECGEVHKQVSTGDVDPLTGKDIKVMCKFVRVYAYGTAKINDWEFVASVEHTPAGNIFKKAMTDLQIPARYRTAPCTCEHCKTNRIRKDTYIIHNTKTGEFRQIGKSCLKDYTGGLSASGAVLSASFKDIFKDAEERPVGYVGRRQALTDPKSVLQFTAEVIRHFGYSRSDSCGESTKDRVNEYWDFLHGHTAFWDQKHRDQVRDLLIRIGFDPKSKEAQQKTEDALQWLSLQDADSDYMWNLKTVCNMDAVDSSKFGLLVSLFPSYDRDLIRQEQIRKEKQSNHIGQIGDRIKVQIVDACVITAWDTQFGTTYVYKFTDIDGNILTWKTSCYIDTDHPEMTLTGTVKDHTEFRGIKQTELTRCKQERKVS